MTNPIPAFWIALLVFTGNLERQHLARTVEAAEELEIGCSTSDLSSLLGRPLADYAAYDGWSFLAIGERPRQWCYGTRIDLDNLFIAEPFVAVNPLPVNIRWFGYSDDDLVIDLDQNGRLAKVKMPRIQYKIDRKYDETLAMIYWMNAIIEGLATAQK